MPDEVLDYGSFRIQNVRGEALRNIARVMDDTSPDVRDTSPNDLERADEAAFIVKPLQIQMDTEPLDDDLSTVKFTPTAHDAFRKERVCFNLLCHKPVFTPVVLCADDFPTVRSVHWFWNSDTRDWWFAPNQGQTLYASQAELVQRLIASQCGEFLDGRRWLTMALSEYESGCEFQRKPNDCLRDYFSALEALYTVEQSGMSQNLATRVAMVLARSDAEYGELLAGIKQLYHVCSSKRHGSQASDLQAEDMTELRTYARRGILMAIELSRPAKGPCDWQTICKRLLNPRDTKLLLELKDIRGGLEAIW